MAAASMWGCSMPRSPSALAPDASPVRPCIALIIDHPDWHARQLSGALAALGATAMPIRLEACRFDTQRRSGVCLPGFGERLPDAVLVRCMSGGSFQAVTLRLGLLHALGENGVLVMNTARAIERCVDKSMTSFLLARAGIPTPATWAMESRAAACALLRREARRGPLVLKPLFGSQGRGLRLVHTEDEVPDPATMAGVYYLQRFVGVERDGFRDFRLLISNGRVVTAMVRHAAQWITNIKQGGRPIAAVVDTELRQLAVAAAHAVGAAFAGVDIVYDSDGRPSVLEVNSMPAWSGLQRVTKTNIAAVLAADLCAAIAGGAAHGARG
jgi:tetrahydromethanopterin:alpha-L-glutamate ligase